MRWASGVGYVPGMWTLGVTSVARKTITTGNRCHTRRKQALTEWIGRTVGDYSEYRQFLRPIQAINRRPWMMNNLPNLVIYWPCFWQCQRPPLLTCWAISLSFWTSRPSTTSTVINCKGVLATKEIIQLQLLSQFHDDKHFIIKCFIIAQYYKLTVNCLSVNSEQTMLTLVNTVQVTSLNCTNYNTSHKRNLNQTLLTNNPWVQEGSTLL